MRADFSYVGSQGVAKALSLAVPARYVQLRASTGVFWVHARNSSTPDPAAFPGLTADRTVPGWLPVSWDAPVEFGSLSCPPPSFRTAEDVGRGRAEDFTETWRQVDAANQVAFLDIFVESAGTLKCIAER